MKSEVTSFILAIQKTRHLIEFAHIEIIIQTDYLDIFDKI